MHGFFKSNFLSPLISTKNLVRYSRLRFILRLSLIRVFGYLAKSSMERAKNVLASAGVPFFLDSINVKVNFARGGGVMTILGKYEFFDNMEYLKSI